MLANNTQKQKMKTKPADKNIHTKPVEFSCHAPDAKAVFVAGTFNEWKPDAAPLHNHLPNAKWDCSLGIDSGRNSAEKGG